MVSPRNASIPLRVIIMLHQLHHRILSFCPCNPSLMPSPRPILQNSVNDVSVVDRLLLSYRAPFCYQSYLCLFSLHFFLLFVAFLCMLSMMAVSSLIPPVTYTPLLTDFQRFITRMIDVYAVSVCVFFHSKNASTRPRKISMAFEFSRCKFEFTPSSNSIASIRTPLPLDFFEHRFSLF
jgi:hypothetical protein